MIQTARGEHSIVTDRQIMIDTSTILSLQRTIKAQTFQDLLYPATIATWRFAYQERRKARKSDVWDLNFQRLASQDECTKIRK
jgi:hypothetical protein